MTTSSKVLSAWLLTGFLSACAPSNDGGLDDSLRNGSGPGPNSPNPSATLATGGGEGMTATAGTTIATGGTSDTTGGTGGAKGGAPVATIGATTGSGSAPGATGAATGTAGGATDATGGVGGASGGMAGGGSGASGTAGMVRDGGIGGSGGMGGTTTGTGGTSTGTGSGSGSPGGPDAGSDTRTPTRSIACFSSGAPDATCRGIDHCCFDNYSASHNGYCATDPCSFGRIECDGPEDCAPGNVCCAERTTAPEGFALAYVIACRAGTTCSSGTWQLCHSNANCSAGRSCQPTAMVNTELPHVINLCGP